MKCFAIPAVLLLSALFIGCASSPTADRAPLNPADADAQIAVTGMSCPQCANNIKDIMERVEGIDQARVDLGDGRVLIAFAPGQTVDAEVLALAVKDAGFTPGKVSYAQSEGAEK